MENPLNKYGHKNKLYPIKRIAHERLHCIKMDLNTKSIKQIIIILDIPYAMNTFPIIPYNKEARGMELSKKIFVCSEKELLKRLCSFHIKIALRYVQDESYPK